HDGELPERARQQAAMARSNLELEARFVDDLLDVNRIARGKLTLRTRPGIDLHELIRRTVDVVRPEADEKRVVFELHLEAQARLVTGDDARLQQLFWNIFRNAIKFSQANSGAVVLVRTRTA